LVLNHQVQEALTATCDELKAYHDRLEQLEPQLDDQRNTCAQLQTQVSAQQQHVRELEQQLTAAKQEIAAAREAQHQAEQQLLNSEISSASSSSSSYTAQQYQLHMTSIEQQRELILRLSQEAEQASIERDKFEDELLRLKRSTKGSSAPAVSSAAIEQAQHEVTAMAVKYESVLATNVKLSKQVKTLEAKVKMLQTKLERATAGAAVSAPASTAVVTGTVTKAPAAALRPVSVAAQAVSVSENVTVLGHGSSSGGSVLKKGLSDPAAAARRGLMSAAPAVVLDKENM